VKLSSIDRAMMCLYPLFNTEELTDRSINRSMDW